MKLNNKMPETIHYSVNDSSNGNTEDGVWKISQNPNGLKWSSRGWCYNLEGAGLVTKGDFDKAQDIINECRKKGYLPIDFVAQDDKRAFAGVEEPSSTDPVSYFKDFLREALKAEEYYTPNWWEGEQYYIQMLVEKIDLRTIFEPICRQYHIPIANTGGWYDILERAQIVSRYQKAEKLGLKPVLLYCGDLDPWGRSISDNLLSNFYDIQGGTRWSPSSLNGRIDRFGLEPDFIDANQLTWIENLESGKGNDMSQMDNSIVTNYIAEMEGRYGVGNGIRKCEANAIAVAPEAARELCRTAIERWLGENALDRFEAKRQRIRDTLSDYKRQVGAEAIFERILNGHNDS